MNNFIFVKKEFLMGLWQLWKTSCHFCQQLGTPQEWTDLRVSRIYLQQSHGNLYEQTFICRQLFSEHMVGSQPIERKKNASNFNTGCLYPFNVILACVQLSRGTALCSWARHLTLIVSLSTHNHRQNSWDTCCFFPFETWKYVKNPPLPLFNVV